MLANVAGTNMGRVAWKAAQDALGEGAEEFISTVAEAYLAKLWNGDERGARQTFEETFPDALYAAFQGATTSMLMNAPDNISNIQYARALDTALDVINNGGTLTEAEMAAANASRQYLTNSWGADSPWSRTSYREWKDTKSSYFDSFFPQMGDLTGNAADLSGIDPSKLIMLPMVNDADTAQNGQTGQKDFIALPMRDDVSQNSQMKAAETASQTNLSPNTNDVSTELSADNATKDSTAQTDTAAETASPEMIAEQNARIRRQALEKGKAKGIELDTAEKLMKVTGLKLRYIYEENSGVDGFISRDTVTVNLASDTSAFSVAAHEAGHSMKLTDAGKFEAFQNSVQ